MYWTLDRWQWTQPFRNDLGDAVGPFAWGLPVGCHAALDLRTFAECGAPGQVGVPGRYGVFVSTAAPVTGTVLADDPRSTLTTKQKRTVFDTLGVQVAAAALDEYLWELMNVHADDTRICKPLLPKTGFELELLCGPLVKRMQTGKGGPGWDNLVKQRQADYAAMKLSDPDFAQRLLSKWEESYPGSAFTDFIPAGLPVIEPLPHRTTITESFNGADKAGLGYDLTWTETSSTADWDNFSNAARYLNLAFGTATARAESDLSSADHYAQAVMTRTTLSTYMGCSVRYASAAQTFYTSFWHNPGADTITFYLSKYVTGTPTNLNTTTSGTPVSGDTFKTEINGSTLTVYENGASALSVSDSAITSGTRCGMTCAASSSGDTFDAWQAADLAAAGIAIPVLTRQYRQRWS